MGAFTVSAFAACAEYVGDDPDLDAPRRTAGADASAAADGAAGSSSGASGLDAGTSDDGGGPVLPPVETLVDGLLDVRAFSIDVRPEGDRLVYTSSSEGLVQCDLPACSTHVVLAAPSADLQAPVLAWRGQVYFVDRFRPFPGFAFTYQRVRRSEADGGAAPTGIDATTVVARLAADSTGVFVAHSRTLGEDGFDNFLTRLDRDGGAGDVVAQRTGVAAPFVLAKSGELTAIARRANVATSTLERVVGNVAMGAGTSDTVVSLAVDDAALYAASATGVVRCAMGACTPTSASAGDAGSTFGPAALTGGRLLLVRGTATASELLACRVNADTCDVVPSTGLQRITDVQVIAGRWYVLGATTTDAGERWAIRRLNFAQ